MRPIGENEHVINEQEFLEAEFSIPGKGYGKVMDFIIELNEHFGAYKNENNKLSFKTPITAEDLIRIALIIQDERKWNNTQEKKLEMKTMRILLENLNIKILN